MGQWFWCKNFTTVTTHNLLLVLKKNLLATYTALKKTKQIATLIISF